MIKAKITGHQYQYGEFKDVEFPTLAISEAGRILLVTGKGIDTLNGVLISNSATGDPKNVGETSNSWSMHSFRVLSRNENVILNNN